MSAEEGAQRAGRYQRWSEAGAGGKETVRLHPHVDVTGEEPERPTVRKRAEHYALPSAERYPLDSYTQVEKAAEYFDSWRHQMPAGVRREYALHLVKRASALGIAVSDNARLDGATSRAPAETFELGLDSRREFLGLDENLLLDKLASASAFVEPDLVRQSLSLLDRQWGLCDHYGDRVLDPYRTVYAPEEQEKKASLDRAVIRRLAQRPGELIEKFGSAFVTSFACDPDAAARRLTPDQRAALELLGAPEPEEG